MLKVGDQAPDFTAPSTDGRTIRLSDLRGKRVVLYFYPKAFTTGCTLETRQFRDAYPEIQALGAEVIGLSVDRLETQCAFAEKERVSFPLIGDPQRAIGKSFDVLWPLLAVSRRVTYILDEEGRVEAVLHHELNVGRHVDEVLQHLRASRRPAAQEPAAAGSPPPPRTPTPS